MKIYNKTNQIQEVELYDKDMSGNLKIYSIYIQAKSSTEIDARLVSPRLTTLLKAGILETDNIQVMSHEAQPKVAVVTPIETKIDEESDVVIPEPPVVEEPEQTHAPANKIPEGSFICPECGKEYASERGLALHMTKAHPQTEN